MSDSIEVYDQIVNGLEFDRRHTTLDVREMDRARSGFTGRTCSVKLWQYDRVALEASGDSQAVIEAVRIYVAGECQQKHTFWNAPRR